MIPFRRTNNDPFQKKLAGRSACALNSRWSLAALRSEYKAVVHWSRFTALLRKKLNPIPPP